MRTHKVVDLSEILSDEMVEASMIRKGAYGNEVSLRGFGKSNLRILADGGLIEGACGSRKDPALSHINLLTVERIQVRQGPFDVTKPGALGGSINVITRKPEQGFNSELLVKGGSADFFTGGGYVSGGGETVQGLAGYSYAQANPYEDGDGNEMTSYAPGGRPYNAKGLDRKSFMKHDVWGKVQLTPAENHRILLSGSYGAGRDILTPRVGMDIESENTVLANVEYVASSLGRFSEALTLSVYHTRVEHNPSDKYRELVGNPAFHRHNEVVSIITGGKIENTQSAPFADLAYGFDAYIRNWNGDMFNDATGAKLSDQLFPDVNAVNVGLYAKADKHFDKLSLSIGLRGERFHTEANDSLPNAISKLGINSNKRVDYLPSGYVSGKYYFCDNVNMFAGIGQSVRTPTAAERYLQPPRGANFSGNPDLKPTQNREGDVGFEAAFLERVTFGAKGFYSFLKDYIYQEAAPKTWTNINAKMYGGDANVGVTIIPHLSTQAGIAFQKGEKVDQPKNNNNGNLAEIPPLKTRLALEYDHEKLFGTLEWIHSEAAENVDVDAGEQKLDGWNVINLRFGLNIWKATLSVGIDNVFNKGYAVANSYEWDVVAGSGTNPPVVNEPGRSIYASGSIYF